MHSLHCYVNESVLNSIHDLHKGELPEKCIVLVINARGH